MPEPLRTFLGSYVDQNSAAPLALSRLLERVEPARIIELGTYRGGLAALLHLSASVTGSDFYTYDRQDRRDHPDELDRLGMKFRQRNIFLAVDEIARLIQGDGITILLCDNGHKAKEFRTFAPYLKKGDYILVHDYGPVKKRGIAICDEHVAEVAPINGLEHDDPEGKLFEAKWLCMVKR